MTPSPGADGPHKRRFRRRTIRVRVEYRVGAATRYDWATTLGAGGMFVETREPLRVGTRLTLRFRLPGGSYPHEIAGRIAWAMPAAPTSGGTAPSPGMGIEFTDSVASAALARELEREPVAAG